MRLRCVCAAVCLFLWCALCGVSRLALPFGEGQHFVQLAGGTNDRTAHRLREMGLVGHDYDGVGVGDGDGDSSDCRSQASYARRCSQVGNLNSLVMAAAAAFVCCSFSFALCLNVFFFAKKAPCTPLKMKAGMFVCSVVPYFLLSVCERSRERRFFPLAA